MQDDFGNQLPSLPQMWGHINELKEELARNTETTSRIETNTSQLIEILNSVKGAFKVLSWVGKLAVPIAAIAGLFAAIKAGIQPK